VYLVSYYEIRYTTDYDELLDNYDAGTVIYNDIEPQGACEDVEFIVRMDTNRLL